MSTLPRRIALQLVESIGRLGFRWCTFPKQSTCMTLYWLCATWHEYLAEMMQLAAAHVAQELVGSSREAR